jgi:hypothetical protein
MGGSIKQGSVSKIFQTTPEAPPNNGTKKMQAAMEALVQRIIEGGNLAGPT